MGIYAEMAAVELQRLESEGKIEAAGRLKICRSESQGPRGALYVVKIWRGKGKKPIANYSFRSTSQREQYILQQIGSDAASLKFAETRKQAAAERAAKMAETLQVGTLLHYSWGWEQTNCDFYQVVERKGMTVWIREIGCRIVEGSGGGHAMSDRRMPARDSFIGDEVLRKRISEGGVTLPYGIASPCGDDDTFYCSWYA